MKFNHTCSIHIPIKMKKHITSVSRKQQHFHNSIPFSMFPPIKDNILLMITCVCMPIQKVQELLSCIENAFFQNLEWKNSLICLQMHCVLDLMLKISHYTQVHKLKSSLTTLVNNNNLHACNQQIKILTHIFLEKWHLICFIWLNQKKLCSSLWWIIFNISRPSLWWFFTCPLEGNKIFYFNIVAIKCS